MLCATPAERKTDPAQPRLTNQDEGEEGLGKEIKALYVEKIRSANERDYEGKALYTVREKRSELEPAGCCNS